MRTEIQAIHFDADQKLLDLVEKRVAKLGTFHDRIVSVEIYLKLDQESSHIKDKLVEIKVHIPRHILFAKEGAKTFENALSEAMGSIKRQLTKNKEKLKG